MSFELGSGNRLKPGLQRECLDDYNNNRTTLAANIGGGTPSFVPDTGLFAGFSGGTNDFVNKYTYNSTDEMTSIVETDQPTGTYNDVAAKMVTFAYDSDGRLTKENRYAADSPGSSTLVVAAAYSYDADSELTDLAYTAQSSTLAAYKVMYNDAGLVSNLYSYKDTLDTEGRTSAYSAWAEASYNYDPAGQVTTTVSGDDTTHAASFSNWQDPANPTDSLPSEDFNYDPTGNRTANTLGSTASATNRMLFDGTYFYRYDAEGNRTAKFKNSITNQLDSHATDVTLYAWDNRNELVGVEHYASYSGTPAADQTITYGVDPFGRTVSRSETDNPGTEEATTTDENYVYDGANVVLVVKDSGQVAERELYAPAVDAIMASESPLPLGDGEGEAEGAGGGQAAGTVSWMLADNQGTIRDVAQASMSDGAVTSTAIVDHVIYSLYGVPNQGAGFTSDPLPRFGFDGMRRDAATGLNITEFRSYDPQTGTWLSQDPISFAGGQSNLSQFVGNSPTNLIDPSGLWSHDPQYVDNGTIQFYGYGDSWRDTVPSDLPPGTLMDVGSGGVFIPFTGCDCCEGGGYDNPSTAISLGPAGSEGQFTDYSTLTTTEGGVSGLNQNSSLSHSGPSPGWMPPVLPPAPPPDNGPSLFTMLFYSIVPIPTPFGAVFREELEMQKSPIPGANVGDQLYKFEYKATPYVLGAEAACFGGTALDGSFAVGAEVDANLLEHLVEREMWARTGARLYRALENARRAKDWWEAEEYAAKAEELEKEAALLRNLLQQDR